MIYPGKELTQNVSYFQYIQINYLNKEKIAYFDMSKTKIIANNQKKTQITKLNNTLLQYKKYNHINKKN